MSKPDGPPRLLRWLEQLAFSDSRTAMAALEEIYFHVTQVRENLKPRYRDIEVFDRIRNGVDAFLHRAANIAESKTDDPQLKVIGIARSLLMPRRSTRLAYAFRAEVPSGRPEVAKLVLCEPVDPTPEFCVAYALWQMACELPALKWRRYTLRTCKRMLCEKGHTRHGDAARPVLLFGPDTRSSFARVVDRQRGEARAHFYDMKWVMKSGPREYCSKDCQKKQNAEVARTRERERGIDR